MSNIDFGNTGAEPLTLITGSGRGLGRRLAMVAAREGRRVIGLARSGQDAAVPTLPLDLADAGAIAALPKRLPPGPVELLIHNAALRGPTNGLDGVTPAAFHEVMNVNVLAPLLLTRALMPRLASDATVAFVSSRAGSCAEGDDPDRDDLYGISKAALNRAMVKLSRHHSHRYLALHPGWLRTDMGGADAVVHPEDAAAAIFARLSDRSLPSGWFGDYRGTQIGW